MKDALTLVVLAAGAGKRFSPFTTNKALFPFFGRPLVDFTAQIPDRVTNVVIVTTETDAPTFRSMKSPVPTEVVIQSAPSGMAGALLSAERYIAGSSLIVLIADDVTETNVLDPLVAAAHAPGAFGILIGWKSPAYFPGGYLCLEGDRVTGVREKPGAGNEPSPYVVIAGQYIDDADALLAAIKSVKSTHDDVYEKALSALMAKEVFRMVPYTGTFASLKYPWHVLDVLTILLGDIKSYKGKDVMIGKGVIIEGLVYISDRVKIFENTKIVGPVYIGPDTIIGNNNIIRQSALGAGCVTGFNTDITRSYIGDNCWFHSNYVGDSVLEGNISMGSGAVLANLRLDDGGVSSVLGEKKLPTGKNKLGAMIGKGVRIGVNASIMPGVKIGADSFIGSGVVLDSDVPPGSFVMAKPGYTVAKNRTRSSASRDSFKRKL